MLSEPNCGLLGMERHTWQRYTSSLRMPKRSEPNRKPTPDWADLDAKLPSSPRVSCASSSPFDSAAKCSRGVVVGGAKSRGVIAVAHRWLRPSSASSSVSTMRHLFNTSRAPLARWMVSSRRSTLAQRGATSTRSSNPMVFMARAAAPTLPAWLVLIRTKRVCIRKWGQKGLVDCDMTPIGCATKVQPLKYAYCRRLHHQPVLPVLPPTIYDAQSAPHGQCGHQGRPHCRKHNQPRRAGHRIRPRFAKEGQRLRHRSGPRCRASDH